MENNCGNCESKQACVPFFVHENVLMHYNRANKRMLTALIVSLSIVAIIAISLGYMFLTSYNEREKGWQEIIDQRITEVEDGSHRQQDP